MKWPQRHGEKRAELITLMEVLATPSSLNWIDATSFQLIIIIILARTCRDHCLPVDDANVQYACRGAAWQLRSRRDPRYLSSPDHYLTSQRLRHTHAYCAHCVLNAVCRAICLSVRSRGPEWHKKHVFRSVSSRLRARHSYAVDNHRHYSQLAESTKSRPDYASITQTIIPSLADIRDNYPLQDSYVIRDISQKTTNRLHWAGSFVFMCPCSRIEKPDLCVT